MSEASIQMRCLKRIVDATKDFMGNDSRRPITQFIRLDFRKEEKSVTAYAINGYEISMQSGGCLKVDEDFSVYIKQYLPHCNPDDCINISLDGGLCYISCGDSSIVYHQPDGEPFDFPKLMEPQGAPVARIGVNPSYLYNAAKALKGASPRMSETAIMEIRGPLQPIIIKGIYGKGTVMVRPIRICENEEKAAPGADTPETANEN